jgi:hypothetical protein
MLAYADHTLSSGTNAMRNQALEDKLVWQNGRRALLSKIHVHLTEFSPVAHQNQECRSGSETKHWKTTGSKYGGYYDRRL